MDAAEKFYSYDESLYSTNNSVGLCLTSKVLQYDTDISGDTHRLVESCTSCPDGYTLTTDVYYEPVLRQEAYDNSPSCYSFPGLKYCKNNSATGTCGNACALRSKWVDKSTGYQEYHKFSCNSSDVCVESITQYRCAANYYGTTSNGTSGCAACPAGKVCPAGSTSVSACSSNCTGNQYKDGNTCKDCPDPREYVIFPDDAEWNGPDTNSSLGTGINSCYYTLYSNVASDETGTFYLYDNPETGGPDCGW